jgi:hypothetical protein
LADGPQAAFATHEALRDRPSATLNMNRLYVGFAKEMELPERGFLIIDDEVRNIPRNRR